MDCVFFGTPDFAVPSLKSLITSDEYRVKAVFTQPDKKVGRKQILTPPPVKVLALEHNIPVYQPDKIKDEKWLEVLRELKPDLIVTAAFGQILSQGLLDIPKLGTINIHGSLLPKYRGPAPIQWAVINGEKRTGISSMFTDAGIDTGDVLLRREIEIGEKETAGELFSRLADLGAEVLIDTLDNLNTITPEKQVENDASYYPMLNKEIARIDFNKRADEVFSLIKGLNPWPIAHFFIDDLKINVLEGEVASGFKGNAGEILAWDNKNGIVIGCKDGAIRILKLQAAGKKAMDATSFTNGKKLEIGYML